MIRWGLHKPNELGGSTPSLPVPKLFIVVRLCASLLNSGTPLGLQAEHTHTLAIHLCYIVIS